MGVAETSRSTLVQPDLVRPHVLREYALLADGERGALVGPRGDVVWMCFPRWHDDAVFSALIGGGGAYSISPHGPFVWAATTSQARWSGAADGPPSTGSSSPARRWRRPQRRIAPSSSGG